MHNLISIIKLYKNQSVKANFKLTTGATLRSLFKRGELTEEQYKKLRPQNARVARDHVLPKFHKSFTVLPKFRRIVDTPLHVIRMLALI